ncbi:MAG: xanthine dehydrogenase family protein subunit M [Planctomycetota bacterium]
MKAFTFVRPRTLEAAAAALAETGGALHAGGVDLLDRMKEHVDEPSHIVTLLDVPGRETIALEDDGGVRLGAGVTLAALAENDMVRRFLPSLAEAAGQAASPAIRHRATLGGNLAQRTRCGYFRIASFRCWKRGDDVCPVRAETGVQETAAVFGNDACASAHPSSLAPVLQSLGARVHVQGPKGTRHVPLADAWQSPAKGVTTDLALAADEVITAIVLPPRTRPQHVAYEEVRQKAAFDWALVSCGVRAELGEDGHVADVSIVLGSVAPTPWVAQGAEAALRGGPPSAERIAAAAKAATQGATPLAGNAYKVRLVEVAVRRALMRALQAGKEGAR